MANALPKIYDRGIFTSHIKEGLLIEVDQLLPYGFAGERNCLWCATGAAVLNVIYRMPRTTAALKLDAEGFPVNILGWPWGHRAWDNLYSYSEELRRAVEPLRDRDTRSLTPQEQATRLAAMCLRTVNEAQAAGLSISGIRPVLNIDVFLPRVQPVISPLTDTSENTPVVINPFNADVRDAYPEILDELVAGGQRLTAQIEAAANGSVLHITSRQTPTVVAASPSPMR